MARTSNYPPLFDELKQISIADLRKAKYFNPDQTVLGTLSWFIGKKKTSSILISVHAQGEPFLVLSYYYQGKHLKYEIEIAAVKSNLTKGHVLYLKCPLTKKMCRKLYFYNGYFQHREAIVEGFYTSQIYSKIDRRLIKNWSIDAKVEDLHNQLKKKYFKRSYRGRLTKKYLKISNQLAELEENFKSQISRSNQTI